LRGKKDKFLSVFLGDFARECTESVLRFFFGFGLVGLFGEKFQGDLSELVPSFGTLGDFLGDDHLEVLAEQGELFALMGLSLRGVCVEEGGKQEGKEGGDDRRDKWGE